MIAIYLLKAFLTITTAVLAGWAYRFGGSEHGIRQVRQLVDGASIIGILTLWFGWNWSGLLIMGTIWITSTYFKIDGKTNLFTWMLVGLSFGLVPIPYLLFQHNAHWLGFLIRLGILPLFVGFVVRYLGQNVQFSEGFRGAIQILTLPLLLI